MSKSRAIIDVLVVGFDAMNVRDSNVGADNVRMRRVAFFSRS